MNIDYIVGKYLDESNSSADTAVMDKIASNGQANKAQAFLGRKKRKKEGEEDSQEAAPK